MMMGDTFMLKAQAMRINQDDNIQRRRPIFTEGCLGSNLQGPK